MALSVPSFIHGAVLYIVRRVARFKYSRAMFPGAESGTPIGRSLGSGDRPGSA